MTEEPLGRFGHHPDPAIDFEVEVECLDGMAINRRTGFDPEPGLDDRVFKAMQFRVGGDPSCVDAKRTLREIEAAKQEPGRCPHCGAGVLGNCGARGAEIPREACPHAPKPSWGATEHAERLAELVDFKAGLITLAEAQERAEVRRRLAGLSRSDASLLVGDHVRELRRQSARTALAQARKE